MSLHDGRVGAHASQAALDLWSIVGSEACQNDYSRISLLREGVCLEMTLLVLSQTEFVLIGLIS